MHFALDLFAPQAEDTKSTIGLYLVLFSHILTLVVLVSKLKIPPDITLLVSITLVFTLDLIILKTYDGVKILTLLVSFVLLP